jgi:hypothetical protein
MDVFRCFSRRTPIQATFTFVAFSALLACASISPAHAIACASGPYRAGCAGPNGAAVVRKPAYRPGYGSGYHGGSVTCARGVYRAGCVGPQGGVVRRY